MGRMTGFGIFGMVPIQLLTDVRLNESALRAYVAVSSYIGDRDYCSASRESLAKRAGLSLDQLWRGLDALIKSGWLLRVRRGRGQTNCYRRMMPQILEEAEDLTPELNESAAGAKSFEPMSPQPVRSQDPMSPQPVQSPIKRSDNSKRSENTKSPASPDAARLAELILTERRRIDPGFQSAPGKREGALLRWSGDIEKIVRLDGRSWKDVERVLRWALRDSFWSKNILSGDALRRQFDRLYVQAVGTRVPIPSPDIFDSWKIEQVKEVG